MNFAETLEFVVARTGVERYRELCDPEHPDYMPGYPALIERIAAELEDRTATPSPLLAGDLIAIASSRLGADRLAHWVAARLGAECHCEERRLRINALDSKLRKYLGIGG